MKVVRRGQCHPVVLLSGRDIYSDDRPWVDAVSRFRKPDFAGKSNPVEWSSDSRVLEVFTSQFRDEVARISEKECVIHLATMEYAIGCFDEVGVFPDFTLESTPNRKPRSCAPTR